MPRATNTSRTRGASRASNPSRVPGWVWLFTGAVLGAFVMFLIRLAEVPPGGGAGTETAASAPAKAPEEQKQPRFDFYKILKETEVPVPTVEHDDAPVAAADTSQYILQVASFKGMDDAEQLRAELILLNLDAQVETARVRNGETWHRVLVGPFESRSKLAKARSILVSNRLEALVLKRSSDQG